MENMDTDARKQRVDTVPQNRGNFTKKNIKTTSCAIIDHLTHKNLLKSTTNNDFGGKTLIKFYFNDCFKFY